jgi:hypothetical protein
MVVSCLAATALGGATRTFGSSIDGVVDGVAANAVSSVLPLDLFDLLPSIALRDGDGDFLADDLLEDFVADVVLLLLSLLSMSKFGVDTAVDDMISCPVSEHTCKSEK